MRDAAGSPERARWLHLARSRSQSHRAIWFILPARGASHMHIMLRVENNLDKYGLPHIYIALFGCLWVPGGGLLEPLRQTFRPEHK